MSGGMRKSEVRGRWAWLDSIQTSAAIVAEFGINERTVQTKPETSLSTS
jgi:hypothetical protein